MEKQLEKTDKKLIGTTQQVDHLIKKLNESNNIILKLKNGEKIDNEAVEDLTKDNSVALQEANAVSSKAQVTLESNAPLLNPDIDAEINSLIEIVNEYKIQILYNKANPNQRSNALEIKKSLEKIGVKSSIQVASHDDTASSDQIRYFKANEREVAYALQEVMIEAYPQRNFNLQTVYTRTPGSVSIFLKS